MNDNEFTEKVFTKSSNIPTSILNTFCDLIFGIVSGLLDTYTNINL